MFANTQRGGLDLALPDVCSDPEGELTSQLTSAEGALGVPATCDVLFAGAPAHDLSTLILVGTGNHRSQRVGVVSDTERGPSRHTTGVDSVLIAGMPATRLGSLTSQNAGNAQGARVRPSQTKVLLL
jgi:uncharacterized Zn-binding protein involved in type VI secretion